MTRRVKVAGDRFHGRVPEGAIYVGRQAPGLKRSPYANPYTAKVYGLDESLRLYREHLRAHPELVDLARVELAGQTLACWCRLEQECHGDILLAVIGGERP